MIIGIDFDNTIVSYDELFYQIALERGFIQPHFIKTKKQIRDYIRTLPEGETKWQEIQAVAYGPRITEAPFTKGTELFLKECKKTNIPVYIVSHKTDYATYDTTRTNLRVAALQWMEQNNFFDPHLFPFKRELVFFESTRISKIERIKTLGCTHFIDDLEETFLEKTFPPHVIKILFSPIAFTTPSTEIKSGNWDDIAKFVFRK